MTNEAVAHQKIKDLSSQLNVAKDADDNQEGIDLAEKIIGSIGDSILAVENNPNLPKDLKDELIGKFHDLESQAAKLIEDFETKERNKPKK